MPNWVGGWLGVGGGRGVFHRKLACNSKDKVIFTMCACTWVGERPGAGQQALFIFNSSTCSCANPEEQVGFFYPFFFFQAPYCAVFSVFGQLYYIIRTE